jgi:hypothetical protein
MKRRRPMFRQPRAPRWQVLLTASFLIASTLLTRVDAQKTTPTLSFNPGPPCTVPSAVQGGNYVIRCPLVSGMEDPAWASYNRMYDPIRVSIGNYPLSAEYASGAFGQVQAIVGAIDIPKSEHGGIEAFDSGISGYARTASATGRAAVGIFGAAMLNYSPTVAGTGPWGSNVIASNAPCPNPGGFKAACDSTSGFDFVGGDGKMAKVTGYEADLNIAKIQGGGYPLHIEAIGNISIANFFGRPGESIAFQAGATTAGFGWHWGFYTNDAQVQNFANVGRAGVGKNQGSQSIVFNSTTSDGTQQREQIASTPNGDLVVSVGGQISYFTIKGPNGQIYRTVQGSNKATNYLADAAGSPGAGPAIAALGTDKNINITLTPKGTGSVAVSSMPTSAGSGGLYVCIDDSGVMYKKHACP